MDKNKKFHENFDLDKFINEYHRMINHQTFEDFWEDICAFAEQNRISTDYVEQEFILDGRFIPVHLEWDIDGTDF